MGLLLSPSLYHIFQFFFSTLNPLVVILLDMFLHLFFILFPQAKLIFFYLLEKFSLFLIESYLVILGTWFPLEDSRHFQFNFDPSCEFRLEKLHELLLYLKAKLPLNESFEFPVVLHPRFQLSN